jgi:hypothetical protein
MTVTGQKTSPCHQPVRFVLGGFLFIKSHQSMHYTTEILDRATGDLKEVSLGDWIPVTELGDRYGVGRKQVRSILHHMGLLYSEGRHGHYRLTPRAVEQGLGKRIDKPRKSKYPFDVISPEGQKLIAENWQAVVAEMNIEKVATPLLRAASDGLTHFRNSKVSEPTTQMEVCWLIDHFPNLSMTDIGTLIGVERPLVSRYANLRFKQLEFAKRLLNRTDAASSPDEVQWPGSKGAAPDAEEVEWVSRRVTKEELLYSLSLYGFAPIPEAITQPQTNIISSPTN